MKTNKDSCKGLQKYKCRSKEQKTRLKQGKFQKARPNFPLGAQEFRHLKPVLEGTDSSKTEQRKTKYLNESQIWKIDLSKEMLRQQGNLEKDK